MRKRVLLGPRLWDALPKNTPKWTYKGCVSLRILGPTLHGGGRTLHGRGPDPQNPMCLRARIVRDSQLSFKNHSRDSPLQTSFRLRPVPRVVLAVFGHWRSVMKSLADQVAWLCKSEEVDLTRRAKSFEIAQSVDNLQYYFVECPPHQKRTMSLRVFVLHYPS